MGLGVEPGAGLDVLLGLESERGGLQAEVDVGRHHLHRAALLGEAEGGGEDPVVGLGDVEAEVLDLLELLAVDDDPEGAPGGERHRVAQVPLDARRPELLEGPGDGPGRARPTSSMRPCGCRAPRSP